MSAQARILLICDDRRGHANTVLDHISAFKTYSRHDVQTFNTKALRGSAFLELSGFDAVVIHYSVVLSDPHFVHSHFRDKLRRFKGLKVQFIQDDYRWVDTATAAARDAGIHVLFTVAPEPAASRLYDERLPGVRRVMTLTGYVPDTLKGRPIRPLSARPIEVGYRARDLPFWYGAFSREKAWIGQGFAERAPRYGLKCDIAWTEQDRIYGDRWVDFVSSCRVTLGSESGASIADFDGGAEQSVRAYLRQHPGAPYEEVAEAVLKPYEGNAVIKVISPRVFEAASLGTGLVMFPGGYSGVVQPDEHYIPLAKDFSNMDDVVAKLRDDDYLSRMTKRTYDDLIGSGRWSYQEFIKEFDAVIDEEVRTPRRRATRHRMTLARVERAIKVPGIRVRLLRGAHRAWRMLSRNDPTMRFDIEYGSQIEKAWLSARILLTERDLRPLLRFGRQAGAPLDRLLREILEISLLRRAARGTLEADQAFHLAVEFDGRRMAVSFISEPSGQNGRGRDETSASLVAALRAGDLQVIEWDHRALGGIVHIADAGMDVGIGFEGLESFSVLARVGRQHPDALERALEPLLRLNPESVPVASRS